MKKLHIKTHGCQMNEYDSARLRDLLGVTDQYIETDSAEEADLILLNTCSIREKAQEKVFHQLGRWKKLKQNNPDLIIGVGGCVASQEGEKIAERAPYVDLIFGPQTIHRLPQMLAEHRSRVKSKKNTAIVDIHFQEIEKFDQLPMPESDRATAFVSIMEGCSKYCSFCVVPYTRGEEVSRPVAQVLEEIRHLSKQGVREINLLGQNVNAYAGIDSSGDCRRLADLIPLVASFDAIERIRFTTSHPIEFGEDLIAVYAEVPELVSHLHLPVQSGSDRVLAMMKRGHTALEYKSTIRALRRIRPDISISSDFIVGFPGETEADFEATMALIKAVNFDTSFSFIYSPRPGTPAAELPDNTSLEEKKQRLQRLQDTLSQQAQAISSKMINSCQRVLVTGYSKRDPRQLQGRTENNRTVNFRYDNPDLIGDFCNVKILDAYSNSLYGTFDSQLERAS